MRRISVFVLATLTAAACGSGATTTAPVAPSIPAAQALQDRVVITGLPDRPDFLINGWHYLDATFIKADGSAVTCTSTAIWSTDNRSVARMIAPGDDFRPTAEPGRVLEVGAEGEANITATCSGVSGQQHVRVSHFDFRGTVRGADGQPLGGVLVRARHSSLPDASTSVTTTGADGTYSVPVRIPKGIIEFSRQGFDLSSTTFTWNFDTVMTANASLAPTSGTIASGSGRLCNVLSTEPGYSECDAAGVHRRDTFVDFRAPRNGPIFVRVQWPGGAGVSGEFIATLQCDNRTVFNYHETDGAGVGYTYDANTACQYRLVLANTTSVRITPFTYAIEIR